MDRRVKERLVGATIVVAVVVLVVPELLSGRRMGAMPDLRPPAAPASEPMRTVTVDVTAISPSEAEPAPQAAAAAASKPEPAVPPTAEGEEQGANRGAAQPPPPAAQQTPKLESAPPSPISEIRRGAQQSRSAEPRRGAWAVQLGSFASNGNAEKLSRALKAQGYAVYVSSSGAGRTLRHRVRIGPYADRDMARRAIAKLKAQGHPASLVPPTAPK